MRLIKDMTPEELAEFFTKYSTVATDIVSRRNKMAQGLGDCVAEKKQTLFDDVMNHTLEVLNQAERVKAKACRIRNTITGRSDAPDEPSCDGAEAQKMPEPNNFINKMHQVLTNIHDFLSESERALNNFE